LTPDHLQVQAVIAFLVAHIVEWAKRNPSFEWIRVDTPTITRIMSHGIAFLTAIGFTVTMSGSFDGGGTITLGWPPADQLVKMVVAYVTSYAEQKIVYRALIKENPRYLVRPPGAAHRVGGDVA
jgi:hypothetical protein